MFLLPPIIAIIIWKMRETQTVTSIRLFDGKPARLWQRSNLAFWLLTAAATLAAATFHAPQLTYTASVPETNKPNLAIAIDLSGSMNAVDWPQGTTPPPNPTPEQLPPPRLDNAKKHIRDLLHNLPQARTALIAFANNTVLAAPLSPKHNLLQQRLLQLKPELFDDGTAIGNALRAAVLALKNAPNGPKVIILLSDGVDHTELAPENDSITPAQAAALAAQQNIVVHTVAIGGSQAFHPVPTEHGTRWDNVGEPLDERQLTQIAETTGGTMFKATDHLQLAEAINEIQEHIARQTQTYRQTRTLPLNPFLLTTAALLALTALAIAHEPKHP